MNAYFAKRQTAAEVAYKGVRINVLDNGIGIEYWFWVHTRKYQGFGFSTRDDAVEDARRVIDELHIH